MAAILALGAWLLLRPGPLERGSAITPAWDGSHGIVFAWDVEGDFDIRGVAIDGCCTERHTEGSADDRFPARSPANQKYAFVSDRSGSDEIWVAQAGSEPVRLTDTGAWNGYPTWSPDGGRLAFVSDRTGTDQVWVMNADGSDEQRLTDVTGQILGLTWSPDGAMIAFGGSTELRVVSPDECCDVTTLFEDVERYIQYPDWSPDGSRIVYTAHMDLWVHDLGSGATARLTETDIDEVFPKWSSDGSQIVFQATRGEGKSAVYVMDADGSDRRHVVGEAP